MTQPQTPVERAGRDRVTLRLGRAERRILRSLVGELQVELADPSSAAPGGSLARLFPPAFPDDPAAESAYRELVRSDLVDGRRLRLGVVEATLETDELDDAQAAAWLAVVNDARLALGVRLGVEDDDGGLPADGDPRAVPKAIFQYLGWLIGAFVDALAETLPEVPGEAGPGDAQP